MPELNIHFQPLVTIPQYISTIAHWSFETFGKFTPQESEQDFVRWYATHTNEDKVPVTLVVLDGDKPAGMGSLVASDDLPDYEHYTPWIAAVYDLPEYRHHGIASHLVRELLILSKKSGYTDTYLYTDQEAHLYEHLRFIEVGKTQMSGIKVTVMKHESLR